MGDAPPVIEKLSHARTRCTFTIADPERSALEHGALERMAKKSQVKGFRTGHTPLEIIKVQTKPEALTEHIIHAFLQEHLPKLLKEQKLTPIIHPKIELTSHTPITLSIIIVEKPAVKFRGQDALRIKKKEIIVTNEEITKTLDTLKKEHAIAEWTDAVTQKQWGIPSLEHLRTSITEALKRQKEQAEQKRREEAFFEQVQSGIDIDLAQELLEDEERQMLGSLQENLRTQNLSFAEWLKRTKKSEETVRTDMRQGAERRLRLRFGIDALLQEHNIAVSDDELTKGIAELLRSLPHVERARLAPLYTPGDESYERFRWQRRMQKLLAMFLE
ncbi:hypothetical protein A3H22_01725 [Candidatus Peribacteria bacterium RIFCSPLOWO2_12_FULL_55_15]|nr:MAG: hypothetical protein A2789_02345 [Candidatus Peribacteria bacterium RIFCSPHIGHO2_01_FULL_54_22]OGJ62655.1 MAG: hypothetical protein A3D12_03775 [Candidatus Peribacteria bacterium RIFCSPHIGHO2_02_FULL_55_24]OGJ64171.1 MAG: hypothetical protein A3E47_03810 [Candidatus Peribacteria bacterium RIFCSPHIGHO2_12_FULL_54_10]OGJ68379.1 MAG: hypothetical protein A2947_02610 [Candidatus Peribacteria bacterium RIFCSPLOWO2_01_FULL_54_110]OGJ70297.1 MAG: hypothetical protein A3H90_03560 [Candidatus Pe